MPIAEIRSTAIESMSVRSRLRLGRTTKPASYVVVTAVPSSVANSVKRPA